jgi:hypothetical protein
MGLLRDTSSGFCTFLVRAQIRIPLGSSSADHSVLCDTASAAALCLSTRPCVPEANRTGGALLPYAVPADSSVLYGHAACVRVRRCRYGPNGAQ